MVGWVSDSTHEMHRMTVSGQSPNLRLGEWRVEDVGTKRISCVRAILSVIGGTPLVPPYAIANTCYLKMPFA
jgi:hypothetical protein